MEENQREYLTHEEALTVKEMFKKYLKSYKEKDINTSDKEWLEQLFRTEIPETTEEEIKQDSEEIVTSVINFDENFKSCNEAAQKGISKETWLADKFEEASVGMSINEYGNSLRQIDNNLYAKNVELAESLARSSDGHIMMSPNLDGNLAEHYIAKTAELSANLQGKNISVSVLESHNANSVDVRAMNHDTGRYQNYQLKFGKDAKATIDLIERGNYNNQRIIVPSEQLAEVQEYFKAKGSSKTITDRIDAWGIKGKSFTKAEMKQLQEDAQSGNYAPEFDYNHFQTKDLAMNIGKNAAVMGLQSAAVTTGFNIASKLFKGEEVDPDELVEVAIKTGADTTIKTVSAGTLQVAVRKGIIKFIPKGTPAGVIANIACVGIENVKILAKIARGELSITKGVDQMGRTTTSMIGGLAGAAKGAAIGGALTSWIPVVGPVLAVGTGLIGGLVGYTAGSSVGNTIYSAAKKVASGVKNVAKAAVKGLKNIGDTIVSGFKKVGNAITSFLGF